MQPTPPPQSGSVNPAQTAGIILAVCALALLVALFTKGWASATEGRDEVNAGLLGFEGCGRGECRSIDWDKGAKVLDIGDDVGVFRILGLLAGLAAIGGLAAAAGLALSRNLQKIPVKPIQFTLGLAAGFLAFFAVRLWMSDDDVDFGPSWSAFLAFGALIAGGAVLQTMLKPLVDQARSGLPSPLPVAHAMPGGHPMTPPPMQAAPAACPRCGGPLEFVAEYQRWFCRNDNQYI